VDELQNLISLPVKYKTKLMQMSTASVLGSNNQEELSNSNKQSPVNYYSKTKAIAENLCNEYLIQGGAVYALRTYWLFGNKNSDFVRFVRKSLEEKSLTRIVSVQFGQPTSTFIVFKIIQLILNQEVLLGIYPSTPSGSASRIEWVYKIADLLKIYKKLLIPVSSNEFEAAAICPINATLSHEIWHKQKLEISKWDDGLKEFLNGIRGYAKYR
jgi:dTDP-4-dehydrorhamnose reductase